MSGRGPRCPAAGMPPEPVSAHVMPSRFRANLIWPSEIKSRRGELLGDTVINSIEHKKMSDGLGLAWDSPRTGPRQGKDRLKTRPRQTQDRLKTGTRQTQDRPKTGTRQTQDRPKTGPRQAQDRHKTGTRQAQDRPKTGTRQIQDRPKTDP